MNAKLLKALILEANFDPMAYSGRSMYGKQCVAFTTDDTTLRALADLIEGCDDPEQAASLLRRARTDDMGRGAVIYWPSIEWSEE